MRGSSQIVTEGDIFSVSYNTLCLGDTAKKYYSSGFIN